ncbi:aspartic peptidase domain-containing protein, partial [Crucibulum laeve]
WIASSSCSTSACSQAGGKVYNPSGAIQTNRQFNIPYLQGAASGPIVWDQVTIGGYSIENQALGAASSVTDEPLSSQFSGILGLALPLNSVIAQQIPPVTSNSPDGAAWASNLFSITPVSSAPSARFLSLALSRPGSDSVKSSLGIGRHPSSLVPDPSKVEYSTLVSESTGTLFWKAGVRGLTVWVDGSPKEVDLGRSNTGSVFPSAILDSGVPYILTTRTVANAIYGAVGIGPGANGQYFVPCTTPLNITITLDDRTAIPLHPLDLTAEPSNDNQASFCNGLIQVADQLASMSSGIGDMILGVPFLRNTYTVMAYGVPAANGSFPDASTVADQSIRPRLGLLGLTDPTTALDEFHTVRVLNKPLTSSDAGKSTGGTNGVGSTHDGDKKLSVGIIVLLGLLGFFFLCFSLFGVRWFLLRRKLRSGKGLGAAGAFGTGGDDKRDLGAYRLALRGSQEALPSEEALRRMRYEEYLKEKSSLTGSSGMEQTLVGGGVALVKDVGNEDGEFGYRRKDFVLPADDDTCDPKTGAAIEYPDATLVGSGRGRERDSSGDPDSSPERVYHRRTDTEARALQLPSHGRQLSVAVPLLPTASDESPNPHPNISSIEHTADTRNHDYEAESDLAEFGAGGMAGIGTASRTSKIDASFRDSTTDSSYRESRAHTLNQSVSSTSSGGGDVGAVITPLLASHSPVSRGRLDRAPVGPRLSVGSRTSVHSDAHDSLPLASGAHAL